MSRKPLAKRDASVLVESTYSDSAVFPDRALRRRPSQRVRWSAQPPTVFTTGDVAAMAMYAGCGVGDIADVPAAAQIVERMMAEAVPLLPPGTLRPYSYPDHDLAGSRA
jgi:hypothetical protein